MMVIIIIISSWLHMHDSMTHYAICWAICIILFDTFCLNVSMCLFFFFSHSLSLFIPASVYLLGAVSIIQQCDNDVDTFFMSIWSLWLVGDASCLHRAWHKWNMPTPSIMNKIIILTIIVIIIIIIMKTIHITII